MPIVVPHDGNSIHRIALLPRDIYISETRLPGPQVNRFEGIITSINSSRDIVRLGVKVGENNLLAEMPHHLFEGMNLSLASEVFLILKLRRIRVHEDRGGVRAIV